MTSRWHKHLKKWNFTRFFAKRGATDTFLGPFCKILLSGCFVFLSFFQLNTYSKIVFFQFFVRFSFLAVSFTMKKHNPKLSGDCFCELFPWRVDGTDISKSEFSPVFSRKRRHKHFWIFLSDSSFWLFWFFYHFFHLKTYSKIVFFQFFVRFFFLAASFTIKNIIQNLVEIVFPAFSMTSRWHRHLKKWNFTRFLAIEVPQTLFLDFFVRFFFLVVWFSNHFSIKNLFKNRFFQFFVRFSFLAASFTIKNIMQNLVEIVFFQLFPWRVDGTDISKSEISPVFWQKRCHRHFFLLFKYLFKNRFFQFFVRFFF